MGIRPEALTPGFGPIQGELELIEHLGSEALVYLKTGGARIIAKAPSDFQEKPGKTISLALDSSNLHFFHEGKRISV